MNELKFHLVPREGLQIAMGNQTCDGFSVHPQGAGAGSGGAGRNRDDPKDIDF